MSTVSPPPDRPQPRRLNFSKPDPAPLNEHDAKQRAAAIEERRRKPEKFPGGETRSRLPDGSRFEDLVFSEPNVEWTGKLLVEGEVFEDRSGGVMNLLVKLDAAYRAWVDGGRKPRNKTPGA